MTSKLFFFFLVSISISLVVSSSFSRPAKVPTTGTGHIECIDDLEEFGKNNWRYYSDYEFTYAETSQDLPFGFRDKFLENRGIFYTHNTAFTRMLYKDPVTIFNVTAATTSSFIYIKYYTHLAQIDDQYSFTSPVAIGGNAVGMRRLNGTSNFEWSETFLELDVPLMKEIGIRIGSFNFNYDDYLFVDRIILAQGISFDGMEELKKLCFDPPQPPPFECEASGYFGDTEDCDKFHVCQALPGGTWDDSIFTCPAGTVWCQHKQWCDYEDACPCPLN